MTAPPLLPLLLLVPLVGCSASTTSRAAPHDVRIVETADPGAAIQADSEHKAGHFRIRVLTARCGIEGIVGTHAEFMPKRPLCVVRLRVTSDDAVFHSFSTTRQRLLMSDKAEVAPAPEAMHIKRQPLDITLGGHDVVELDVWFEPPTGPTANAIELFGDTDPDPGGVSVSPAGEPSAVVPLSGLGD